MTRLLGALLVALLGLFGSACNGTHHRAPNGPLAAVYRATFSSAEPGANKRFRFWVYAAAPDRLHGEIVSAMGTTELVIDAGAGRLSIFFVRDRLAFVGAADESSLKALTGLPIGTQALVQALRGADPGSDSELTWAIQSGNYPYPDTISVAYQDATLELNLKRVRPLRGAVIDLGTGRIPDGVEVQPLAALEGRLLPGIEAVPAEIE